jgi:hypothetical protein
VDVELAAVALEERGEFGLLRDVRRCRFSH